MRDLDLSSLQSQTYSSNVERLLHALTRPELFRVARAYELALSPRPSRDELVAGLAALPQFDGGEVVCHVLRRDELPRLARALGVPHHGSQAQVAARIVRALRYAPFEVARVRARALGLNTVKDWRRWVKANDPQDMPAGPDSGLLRR